MQMITQTNGLKFAGIILSMQKALAVGSVLAGIMSPDWKESCQFPVPLSFDDNTPTIAPTLVPVAAPVAALTIPTYLEILTISPVVYVVLAALGLCCRYFYYRNAKPAKT